MTGKITTDRELMERVLDALECSRIEYNHHGKPAEASDKAVLKACAELRTALGQPKTEDAVPVPVPAGWVLVPVEPTPEMVDAACQDGTILGGRPVWKHSEDVQAKWRWKQMVGAAPQPPVQKQHTDDVAVSRFAEAMKSKLAEARDMGRGGWDDPEQCTVEYLAKLLVDHIPKGDLIDVANFAMMLHQRRADNGVLSAAMYMPAAGQEPLAWANRSMAGSPVLLSISQHPEDRVNWGNPVPLYTHPQNLNCKSNQKRLATLWGYVKAQPLAEPQIAKAWSVAEGEHNASAVVKRRITRAIEVELGITGEDT